MNVFKIQIKDNSNNISYVDECLRDCRITTHEDYGKLLIENLKRGDIGIVHKGNFAVCLVEILYKITDISEIKGKSLGHDFKVKILQYYVDIPDTYRLKNTGRMVGPSGTCAILDPNGEKVYPFIMGWYHLIQENMQKEEIIKLLKYKKQIILQGPPGTGKTRLAKGISTSLTLNKKGINPMDKIEDYFRNFQLTEDFLERRSLVNNLNQTFTEKFRKEDLKQLALEDYALGSEELDNFCYWIEYKLIHTGKYTGRATKGKIYWDSDAEEYKKNGFVKDIENDEEAMQKVAELLYKIVSEEVDDYPIGKGFVLKVLNSYYPEKYFPINSEKCLDNFLKLIRAYDNKLTYLEKNKKVQSFFVDINSKYDNKLTNYEFMYFLFDNFDLKGDLKIENDTLITEGEYKLIQFHPSYTYEDFIRGIIAESKGDKIEYKTVDKILAEFSLKALKNPTSNYILVIDEINRANLSSVLGELIYALEYRWYFNESEQQQKEAEVVSMYSVKNEEQEESRTLKLPENLYVIGTMNTADRSVGHIDYAVRRRFAFVDVLPKDLSDDPTISFNIELFLKVKELFTTDDYTNKSEYLSGEFDPKDVALGHSYFIDKTDEGGSMDIRLEYEIKPILREYVKDGILKESAREVIEGLR